jgi:hypothetical protein
MKTIVRRAVGCSPEQIRGLGGTWQAIRRVSPFLLMGALPARGPYKWVRPFIRAVWDFRTVRGGRVTLHYSQSLDRNIAPQLLLVAYHDELERLQAKFGFRLRRVNVFLFRTFLPITDIFGPEYGALAEYSSNSIMVGDHPNVDEDIRHELVHLFAGRWNLYAPPLLAEGLAVHLQQRWAGHSIARLARRVGSRSEWSLRDLLNRTFFFSRAYRNACYLIAGSFTGFLIDEFGWAAYRKLYRCCRPYLVEWAFKRSLGVSLEEAEAQWRRST